MKHWFNPYMIQEMIDCLPAVIILNLLILGLCLYKKELDVMKTILFCEGIGLVVYLANAMSYHL